MKEAVQSAKRFFGGLFGGPSSENRKEARALFNGGVLAYKNSLYQQQAVGCGECEIDLFTQAIKLVSDEPWYYFWRGRSYLYKSKDFQAALEDFKQALRLTEDPLFFMARGIVYECLEEYAKAFHDYSKALRNTADLHDQALSEKSMQRVVSYLKPDPKTIAENRICLAYYPNEIRYLSNLGDLYLESAHLEKAKEYFQRVKRLDPMHAHAHSKLIEIDSVYESYNWNEKGKKYLEKGYYDSAIDAFQRAIAININKALFWNNLGIAFFHSGEHGLSIEYFEKAVEIEPNAQRYYNLGRAHFRVGNLKTALKYCGLAFKAAPDHPEYRRSLHLLKEAMQDKKRLEREKELGMHEKGLVDDFFDFSLLERSSKKAKRA